MLVAGSGWKVHSGQFSGQSLGHSVESGAADERASQKARLPSVDAALDAIVSDRNIFANT